MSKFIDITGQTFGRLTVIRRVVRPGVQAHWECVCTCGATAEVGGFNLRSGSTKSCGCLGREVSFKPGSQHRRWVGDGAGYRAAHDRVRAVRGWASTHCCADCGAQASDYSYIKGCPEERVQERRVYCLHPEHYVPRCKSCHAKHDGWINNMRTTLQ